MGKTKTRATRTAQPRGDDDTSGHAAELNPSVEMTGVERFQLIRVLSSAVRPGVDKNDNFEDVMEALEEVEIVQREDGSGVDTLRWDWEAFIKSNGLPNNDPRGERTYELRMRRKTWGTLASELRELIERAGGNPNAPEPARITRMLTKIYRRIQKVI